MRWNWRFQSLMALAMLTIGGSCAIPTIAQDTPSKSIGQRQCPLRYPAGDTSAAAIAELQAQLTAARKTKDMAAVGNTLNFLGNIYRDLGLYSQALKVYDESIGIGKSIKSASLEAASIAGRAYTELELGQYDQAIAGFEQALKLRRTLNLPPLEGLTLNNLGIAYAATNQPQMAQAAYQQGIRMTTTDLKARPMVFTQWLRWNQANLKFATQGDAADFAPDRPGFVPPNKLDRTNYGAFLNNLALVYEADGRPDEALKIYGDALKAFVPTGNFSCQRTAWLNQGRLLAQQGQTEAAIAAYYEAIGVTFRVLRDSDLPSTEKASYRSMVTPIYQELAALLRRQGRDQDAQSVLQQLTP
jgi:tetratricopeptide (TPR) repeat protein